MPETRPAPPFVARDRDIVSAGAAAGGGVFEKSGSGDARRLLGHTNISTTQRYMHLDDRELAEAQDLVE